MTAPTNPPHTTSTNGEHLHAPVIDWFEDNARDLPWRHPDAGPWGVMVSEFMLQQTPVTRVLPVYEQWLARWPRPADLAQDAPGEAVRAWGRLGYPRRALRLHGAATAITERHGGDVPTDHAQLLALPGIGEYTAAAVASFAYGQRHAVLDTNVRRVFARAVTGVQYPPNATTAAERKLARALLPRTSRPPPAGPPPPWNSAPWSARRRTRRATAAPSQPSAPGTWPESRTTRARPAAARHTPARTARSAANSWPYSAKRPPPSPSPHSTAYGTNRYSGPEHWTAWYPTAS